MGTRFFVISHDKMIAFELNTETAMVACASLGSDTLVIDNPKRWPPDADVHEALAAKYPGEVFKIE